MSDIVHELRLNSGTIKPRILMDLAADEIEALRRKLAIQHEKLPAPSQVARQMPPFPTYSGRRHFECEP